MEEGKIFFGIITRSLTSASPIVDFLDNAQKFGHTVSALLICYMTHYDAEVLKELESRTTVILIKRGNPAVLRNLLKHHGIKQKEVQELIFTPHLKKYNRVAYGTSRNMVLLTALLMGGHYLFFFDTDIYPQILTRFDCATQDADFTEVDFIGNHLQFLQARNDIVVTTSDYTGYYIVPQMSFPGMRDLLIGVQKEDRYNYITSVRSPVTQDYYNKDIFNTSKILGGNLAINLSKPSYLSPFYSQTMVIEDECYLGRGEDTLFGPLIQCAGGRCIDIDLKVFHNCFGDFPLHPDIRIRKNRDRFFYACMGWIIRNPFYNWLHGSYLMDMPKIDHHCRYIPLLRGAMAAAEYFEDDRFLILPLAFNKAYETLPQWIAQFERLINVWHHLQITLERTV